MVLPHPLVEYTRTVGAISTHESTVKLRVKLYSKGTASRLRVNQALLLLSVLTIQHCLWGQYSIMSLRNLHFNFRFSYMHLVARGQQPIRWLSKVFACNKLTTKKDSNKLQSWCSCLTGQSIIWDTQQEVLGRTNRLLSLIRHGPYWKQRVQQFFYCCVCIHYHGNVSAEPLPSNEGGGGYIERQIQTHRQ
jgi:hypothetical protein